MDGDKYDAFICYSRAADTDLAMALRYGLHDFNRPWYKLRALRVFRDDSSLSANPAHWPAIAKALDQSRYLILLASEQAARSQWVERELRYWCQHKDVDHVHLVLTDPEPDTDRPADIRWDESRKDFDWSVTKVLPMCLSGVFADEPRWIRLARTMLSSRDPVFKNGVADLAAPIHGLAKDEVIGSDVQRHRVRTRIIRTVSVTIVAALVVATWQYLVARSALQDADTQLHAAVAGRLVVQADAIQDTDSRTALQLGLAAHQIQPGPATVAGLVRTLTSPLGVRLGNPLRHAGPVQTVAFSPDSRTLATGTSDGTVTLWDVTDRRHAHQLCRWTQLGDEVTSVAFSPDGHTLAGAVGRSIMLWNLTDRTRPQRIGQLPPAAAVVKSLAFGGRRALLAAGSRDGTTILWDVADPTHPRPRGQPLPGHAYPVNTVALSQDDRMLATGSDDHTVLLWDVTDPDRPRQLGQPVTDTAPVLSLAFGPDSRTLVSTSDAPVNGADTATVIVRDISDPELPRVLGQPIYRPSGSVRTVAFGPTGSRLATGGTDNVVAQWDMTDRARPRWLGHQLAAHTNAVVSIAFSPDGRTLATGSYDQTAILWDVDDKANTPRRLDVPPAWHTNSVRKVAFSADRRIMATGGLDNMVILWDVRDQAHPWQLGRLRDTETLRINGMTFSPDGRTLAIGNAVKSVTLLDVSDPAQPKIISHITIGGEIAVAGSVAFSPDGSKLAIAGFNNVLFWNVTTPATPQYLGQIALIGGPISELAFNRDNDTLAVGLYFGTIDLVAAGDGTHPAVRNTTPMTGHTEPVSTLAFSPDGHLLASGSQDSTIILWDVTDRANPHRLGQPLTGHNNEVRSLAFSDMPILATGSADNSVILWYLGDPSHPALLTRLLSGAANPVSSVAFSPDGRALAAGTTATTPILWNLDALRALINDPTHRACALTGLDESTWTSFVPERIPYQNPC